MKMSRKTKSIVICGLMAASILVITEQHANADFAFGNAQRLGPPVNSLEQTD